MSGDYLWDKSGSDPEVERLETLLAPFRHGASGPVKIAPISSAPPAPLPRRARRGIMIRVAFALAAALALFTSLFFIVKKPGPSLGVTRRSGDRITADRLAVGDYLETDQRSHAEIALGTIGTINVEPETRVRLVNLAPDAQRLDLQRGTLSARVTAPPRIFTVGIPSADAVDLGCAYSVHVEPSGQGFIEVTWGWVSLENGPKTSLVPAGARCETRPGFGPGTPYFTDAPSELKDAVRRFDFEKAGREALDVILAKARPRDSLTIFHLIPRADAADRERLVDHLWAFTSPPPDVDLEKAKQAETPALDAWKSHLITTW